MRPIVPVSLVGNDTSAPVLALVDSGCEHVLAAPWLANDVGIDAEGSTKSVRLGIGGDTVNVRFVDLTLRLHPPGGSDDDFSEWQAEVGFVHHWRPTWPILLGQVGFFDQFTVSMSRNAQAMAVEVWNTFDSRFGIGLAD